MLPMNASSVLAVFIPARSAEWDVDPVHLKCAVQRDFPSNPPTITAHMSIEMDRHESLQTPPHLLSVDEESGDVSSTQAFDEALSGAQQTTGITTPRSARFTLHSAASHGDLRAVRVLIA